MTEKNASTNGPVGKSEPGGVEVAKMSTPALHAAIARRAGTSIARAEEWYHGEFLPAFIELLGREKTLARIDAALA